MWQQHYKEAWRRSGLDDVSETNVLILHKMLTPVLRHVECYLYTLTQDQVNNRQNRRRAGEHVMNM